MFSDIFMETIASTTAVCLSITELLKRMLKVQGSAVVVLSVLVSFAVSLPALSTSGAIQYLTLSIFTALSANGIFKAVHKH